MEIVEAIKQAGGWLEPNGNYIRYRLPEQSAGLLEELQRHKSDILRLLRERCTAFGYLMPFIDKARLDAVGPRNPCEGGGRSRDRAVGRLTKATLVRSDSCDPLCLNMNRGR